MESTSNFCPNCGAPLKPGTRFCPQCGADIHGSSAQNASMQNGSQPYASQPYSSQPHASQPYASMQNTSPRNDPAPQAPQAPVHSSGKRSPAVYVAAGLAVALIAVIAVLWSGRSKESSQTGQSALTQEQSQSTADDWESPMDTESLSAEEEEYIACVDETIQMTLDAQSELSDMIQAKEDFPYSSFFARCEGVFFDLEDSLEVQRTQMDAMTGVSDDLKNAGDELFNMLDGAIQNGVEVFDFLGVFRENTVDGYLEKPSLSDYTMLDDYYTDLNEWYSGMMDFSEYTSCPSAVTNEWNLYLDSVDLCGTALNKMETGLSYGDPLRNFSAQNLAARSDIMSERGFERMLSSMDGELAHVSAQIARAQDLAEEIHEYAQLSQSARETYEFENLAMGEVRLSYEVTDTIYPSLYSTYDSFLIIQTGCINGTSEILVEAEIPGFTQTYKESFSLDSAYKAIYVKPPAVSTDLDLTSAKDAQMTVTISDKNGGILDAKTFPITIKSLYDVEWYSDDYGMATQDNILCYLTPEAEAITSLKRTAIDEISAMTGGKMQSFPGYQDVGYGPYVVTYLQAAGLMRALCETGVRYNMDSYSISGSNQHVLLPEDVIEQRSGLCVETALTVASALQSAGMHTFLIFPPGHAQVAVEIWNTEEYIGEYFLIETTALEESGNNRSIFVEGANALLDGMAPSSGPITYLDPDGWNQYLEEEQVQYVIDCDDAAVLGLAPFSN